MNTFKKTLLVLVVFSTQTAFSWSWWDYTPWPSKPAFTPEESDMMGAAIYDREHFLEKIKGKKPGDYSQYALDLALYEAILNEIESSRNYSDDPTDLKQRKDRIQSELLPVTTALVALGANSTAREPQFKSNALGLARALESVPLMEALAKGAKNKTSMKPPAQTSWSLRGPSFQNDPDTYLLDAAEQGNLNGIKHALEKQKPSPAAITNALMGVLITLGKKAERQEELVEALELLTQHGGDIEAYGTYKGEQRNSALNYAEYLEKQWWGNSRPSRPLVQALLAYGNLNPEDPRAFVFANEYKEPNYTKIPHDILLKVGAAEVPYAILLKQYQGSLEKADEYRKKEDEALKKYNTARNTLYDENGKLRETATACQMKELKDLKDTFLGLRNLSLNLNKKNFKKAEEVKKFDAAVNKCFEIRKQELLDNKFHEQTVPVYNSFSNF